MVDVALPIQCPMPCNCCVCQYIRLEALKAKVQSGEVNEGDDKPPAAWLFMRWAVKVGRLLEAKEEAALRALAQPQSGSTL